MSARHTGRSDLGNLRNFGAMSPQKFSKVAAAVRLEQNDPEAIAKVDEVERARAYLQAYRSTTPDWGAQPPSKPADVAQDVWDTLLALAE